MSTIQNILPEEISQQRSSFGNNAVEGKSFIKPSNGRGKKQVQERLFNKLRLDANDECTGVCDDLPSSDTDPVCMMLSRYKKGYKFFVNHCHARRTICKDNLVLHMVHPSRCQRTNTFFMPVS